MNDVTILLIVTLLALLAVIISIASISERDRRVMQILKMWGTTTSKRKMLKKYAGCTRRKGRNQRQD